MLEKGHPQSSDGGALSDSTEPRMLTTVRSTGPVFRLPGFRADQS